MVFGLGSGLGFIYARGPGQSPVHRFNGRALDLEGKFYALFDRPLQWAGAWQPEAIAAALESGRPLLAQTDLAYLPYYEPVHFPLHGIVVTGWDGGVAEVADTYSAELQRVSAESLRAALEGEGTPFMQPYRIAAAPRIAFTLDAARLERAIARTALAMLEPDIPGTGLPAMRLLIEERVSWRESPDWAWSARFAYQSIEKRGTGGGGFRGLYAQFLEEARAWLPWIDRLDGVERMQSLAGAWSALALDCKLAFVENRPEMLDSAAERLETIISDETLLLADLHAESARKGGFER